MKLKERRAYWRKAKERSRAALGVCDRKPFACPGCGTVRVVTVERGSWSYSKRCRRCGRAAGTLTRRRKLRLKLKRGIA